MHPTETAMNDTLKEGRILVVDDCQVHRTAICRTLQARGQLVDTATEGHQALALAALHDYNVAVLDYEMPGMDGVELFRALRHRQPWIRGVMVTGSGTLLTTILALSSGISRVLHKPATSAELLAAVHQACDLPRRAGRRRVQPGDESILPWQRDAAPVSNDAEHGPSSAD